MPWGYAAAAVGTMYASNKSSKAQKAAAARQADGISNAQGISASAAREAKAEALRLFNPAFSDISTSLNQARGDILSGKTSAQNILNQAFMNSASTYQTAGQQAMNAILGRGTGTPQNQTPVDPFYVQPQPEQTEEQVQQGGVQGDQQGNEPLGGQQYNNAIPKQRVDRTQFSPDFDRGYETSFAESLRQQQPYQEPQQQQPFNPIQGNNGLRVGANQQRVEPFTQQGQQPQPISGLRNFTNPQDNFRFNERREF